MKRVLCWIGGIVLALAAGLAIVISQLDATFISGQISAAVEKATGAPVTFSRPPELSLLPPGARFGAVGWDNVRDGQGVRFTAGGGEARLELRPLLHGDLVIDEVRLDSPALVLLLPDGKAAPAAPGSGNAPAAAPEAAPASAPLLLPLELGRLTLSKGSLQVEKGGDRYDLRDINLSVENLRNGQDAVLRCDFAYELLAGGRTLAGTLALDAQAGLFGRTPRVQNLSLTVTPSRHGLPPAGLGPLQLQGDAALDMAARQLQFTRLSLTVPQGRLGLTGKLRLDGPAFTGSVLLEGSPRKLASALGVPLRPHAQDALLFKGSVAWEGDTLSLSQAKGKLDATPLRAELRLHFRDVLAMEGSLSLGALQLDDYLPLPGDGRDAAASRAGAAAPDGKAVKAAARDEAADWPALNLRLAMASLGWKKAQLRDISLALSGSRGDYRLTSFQGVLGSGGRLSASGGADLPARQYSLDADAADVALGALLEALGKPRSVEGIATLKVHAGTVGADREALLAALSGSGDLQVRNMHIPALASLLQSVPGLKGAVSDTFDQVKVPFVLRKGEADLKPMTASSPKLQARGQAHASLPRQHLQGTATITTLGLDIPVNYEGPFDDLSFSLDPKFALDAVKGLGGSLLEGGKKAGSAAGETAREAGSGIGDAVRGAGGSIRGLLGR